MNDSRIHRLQEQNQNQKKKASHQDKHFTSDFPLERSIHTYFILSSAIISELDHTELGLQLVPPC